jgi:hypothetical protein
MRSTNAIIAICFSIAWVSVAAQTKKPSATVIARGYNCGDFSALLVGHVAATDVHGSSLYGKPDGVLFVFRHGNILRQARNYTLAQVSPNIAAIANVDFMWQCTEASAADGCNIAAKMIVNRSNTPGSLSLQTSDGHAVKCVETEQTQTVTEESANVSAHSLNLVRDALTNAADKLLKSANQSDYVQNAIAVIDRALGDVNQAAAHLHDDSGAVPPSAAPSFDAPAPPSPRINFMLYSSLDSLKSAYDALNRVPGGNFAGYRVRINDDIAAAAEVLVNGIASFNAKHSL